MATQIQQPRPSSSSQMKPVAGTPASSARTKKRRWNLKWATQTLRGQFTTQAVLLLLVSVVLGLIAQSAFSQAHDNLNAIVVESAPSIDAAQKMELAVQDIDSKAADYLATAALTNSVPCELPVTRYGPGNTTIHECDYLTINYDITLFNQALYSAAHNVTFPGEHTAVARITTGFEEYVSDIEQMELEYDRAADPTNVQDTHIQSAHQAYSSASNVLLLNISHPSALDTQGEHTYSENEDDVPSCMIDDPLGQQELLPWQWPNRSLEVNIDCLSSINMAHLKAAYDDSQNSLTFMLVMLILLSVVVCVWLLVVTVRMMFVTHRVINPGLTLATLLALILSIPLIVNYSGFGGRHGAFGEIVQDDYLSVYYAANLNYYATAANTDESRWLIALQDGDQPQVDRWAQDWQKNKQRVELLIARAKQNRTWPEEDAPLTTMQNTWNSYETLDGQIRSTAQNTGDAQRFDDAEKISTSSSHQTFGSFTSAVERLSTANQSHLDSSYNTAMSTTTADALWAIVLFPMIGLLALWGVWLRLKDF